MKKVFRFVWTSVLISAVIYFGIVAVFMLTGKYKNPDPAQRGPAFNELYIDYSWGDRGQVLTEGN
jgi:hypothetical protein